MEVFDYKCDENNELVIVNGDFQVTESTRQHQKHLILANKGAYYANPTIGVGIRNYILNERAAELLPDSIRLEFSKDGMNVQKINIDDFSNINVIAEYAG